MEGSGVRLRYQSCWEDPPRIYLGALRVIGWLDDYS